MKKILLLIFMTIFGLWSFVNSSFADDNFKWEDWEDLKISNSYDRNNEDLKIDFKLDDVDKKPEDKYEVKIHLDWEYYYENLDYNSSKKELEANFKIDIDKKDIDDEYSIRYYVKNKTEDTTVFFYTDYDLEVDWGSWGGDDLDWKDLEISNSYNEDDEKLKVEFVLDNVKKKPKDNYKIKLKLNWKYYKKDLEYNSSDDELKANLSINIDTDDIENEYDTRYYVENTDEDETEYSNKDYTLKVKKETKNLDWKDLEISNSYDKDDEELRLEFVLDDVKKKPKDDYEIKLKLDWESYRETLKYNSSDDKLKASFKIDIDEDDIENEYSVKYYIENIDEDETEYKNTNYKLKTNNNKKKKKPSGNKSGKKMDLDWENINISSSYNKKKERLYVKFYFENIDSPTYYTHKIKMYLNGISYTKPLTFSEIKKELNLTFSIPMDEDELEEYYNIRYYAINYTKDEEEYSNKKYKMYTDTEKRKKEEEKEKNKMSAEEVALKSKTISNVLINKTKKYRTKTKIKVLKNFVKVLKSYIDDYKNLEDLILATCNILEEEIDRLENIILETPIF